MPRICPHCSQTTASRNRCTHCGEVLTPENEIPVLKEIDDPPKPRRPRREEKKPEMSAGVKIAGIIVGLLFAVGTYLLIWMNRNKDLNPRVDQNGPIAGPVPKVIGTVPFPPNDSKKGVELPRPPEIVPPPPLPPLASEAKQLPVEAGHIVAISWDREGQLLYVSTGNEKTWTFRPSTTIPERTLSPSEAVQFPRWSSTTISPLQGRVVITHHGGYLSVGDLASGQTRVLANGEGSLSQWNAAFAPNGSRLATGHGDSKVRIWNLQTGQVDHVVEGFKGQVMSVAFDQAGTVLAASAGEEVKLFSANDLTPIGRIPVEKDQPLSLLSFIEKDEVLVGSDARNLHLIRLEREGERVKERSRTQLEIGDIPIAYSFSPDGRLVLIGTLSRTVELWDVAQRKKSHSFSKLSQTQALAWHPKGDQFAIGQGGQIVIYHLASVIPAK